LRQIRKTLMGVTVVACLLVPATASAQPSTAAPSSTSQGKLDLARDKSKSPRTDLRRYPKGDTAPESRAKSLKPAAGQDESKQVLTSQPLANGAIRYTSYTPAKGVAPEQLAAKLRRRGVKAEVTTPDETSGGISALAGSCGYGIARAPCPVEYWRNNGYDDPQMYFVDHSGSKWPTDAAVYTWNQSYGIDSYYVWGGCPGYGGTHCVHVWSGNYGNSGWSGQTSYATNSDYSYIDGQTVVYLNDYYSMTSFETRSTACHELGHALGLLHAVGSGSCMYSWSSAYPHSDDFALLGGIYSVYR